MMINHEKLARLQDASDAQLDKCRALGERQRDAIYTARSHRAKALEGKPIYLGDTIQTDQLSATELINGYSERFTPTEKAMLQVSAAATLRAANIARELQKARAERNSQGVFFTALSAYVLKVTQ